MPERTRKGRRPSNSRKQEEKNGICFLMDYGYLHPPSYTQIYNRNRQAMILRIENRRRIGMQWIFRNSNGIAIVDFIGWAASKIFGKTFPCESEVAWTFDGWNFVSFFPNHIERSMLRKERVDQLTRGINVGIGWLERTFLKVQNSLERRCDGSFKRGEIAGKRCDCQSKKNERLKSVVENKLMVQNSIREWWEGLSWMKARAERG